MAKIDADTMMAKADATHVSNAEVIYYDDGTFALARQVFISGKCVAHQYAACVKNVFGKVYIEWRNAENGTDPHQRRPFNVTSPEKVT